MKKFRIAVGSHGAHTSLLVDILTRAGWQETGGLDWDLCWGNDAPDDATFRACTGRRRVNHLPGAAALTTKSGLHQTLASARGRLSRFDLDGLVDFEPRTFVLPDDYDEWRIAAAWEPDTWWIRKPAAGARGRGVALVERPEDVLPEPGWVVQEYIRSPHLLDDRKYTLRLYVLVTSLDPCVAFLHDDGFAKLASRPFRRDDGGRGDRFAHLTNPDVLRLDNETPVSSRNLTLAEYRSRLAGDGVDVAALWARIRRIAAATVMCARDAMQAEAAALGATGGFELVGMDVTVDAQLRPWLLECNLGPSLAVEAADITAASEAERDIKQRVVRDVLQRAGVFDPAGPNGFQPLVPAEDGVALIPCLGEVRESDLAALRDHVSRDGGWRPLAACGASHAVVGDSLMLYADTTGEFFLPGAGASVMWLGLCEGLDPEAIAREMAPALARDPDDIAPDVWRAMSYWVTLGLLGTASEIRHDAALTAPRAVQRAPTSGWNAESIFVVDGWRFAIRGPRALLATAVLPAMRECECDDAAGVVDGCLEIAEDAGEFTVRSPGRLVHAGPIALVATVMNEAARQACQSRGATMRARLSVFITGAAAIAIIDPADVWRAPRRAPWWVVVAGDRLDVLAEDGRRYELAGIAWLRQAAGGDGIEPVSSASGLLALLADDPLRVLALDRRVAPAFMRAAARVSCYRVRAGSPGSAQELLRNLVSARPSAEPSVRAATETR